jgi:hypothetical protein
VVLASDFAENRGSGVRAPRLCAHRRGSEQRTASASAILETVLAVPLGGMRLDLVRGELARQLLDLLLLRDEVEVHRYLGLLTLTDRIIQS